MISVFWLPASLIIILYVLIAALLFLRTRRRSGASFRRRQAPDRFRKMKRRTFLLSASLVVFYLLCWTPYNIVAMLGIEWIDESPMHWIFYFRHLIGLNSTLNPLIYGMSWNWQFSNFSWRLSRRSTASNRSKSFQSVTDETLIGNHLGSNEITGSKRSRSSTIDQTCRTAENRSFLLLSPKRSLH